MSSFTLCDLLCCREVWEQGVEQLPLKRVLYYLKGMCKRSLLDNPESRLVGKVLQVPGFIVTFDHH